VSRVRSLVLTFLVFSLLGFGLVADRALLGQVRTAREAVARRADETAGLTALSVRAPLAQIEQGLAAGRPTEGVTFHKLAATPPRSALLSRQPARGSALAREVAAGIAGRVTLNLVAVPWDQALDILVLVNGLEWKRDANVVRVRRSQP